THASESQLPSLSVTVDGSSGGSRCAEALPTPHISAGITSGIPLSAVLQGSGGPGPPPLSPQRQLQQGGITSGIPVTARGITSGIPNVQVTPVLDTGKGFSAMDLTMGQGRDNSGGEAGIRSGVPVMSGSITSGLPVVSAPLNFSGRLACGGEVSNSSSNSPRSSPVHFSSAPSLHSSSEVEEKRQRLALEPGSIPAESFTQMMQGLQASGSDTPPENFSRLLQSLQSPLSRGGGAGGTAGISHGAPTGVNASPAACYYDPSFAAVSPGVPGFPAGGNMPQGFIPQAAVSPLVFQNLQIIREDSGDTPEAGPNGDMDGTTERTMEAEEEGGEDTAGSQDGLYHHGNEPYREHRALTPTSSSELEQIGLGEGGGDGQRQKVRRKSRGGGGYPHHQHHHYAGNPQISITDAQGHVTDVITTDPSSMDERLASDRDLFCGDVSSSFQGNTGVSPSASSRQRSAFTARSPSQDQHQRLQEEQHRLAMQHYHKMLLQQLFNPSWINTHLASIPGPIPSASASSSSSHSLPSSSSSRHGHSSSPFSPYPTSSSSSSSAAPPTASASSSSPAQALSLRPAPYSPSASIILGTSHNTVGSSLRHYHHHHHHHGRSSSSRFRRQLVGGAGHHHFHPHHHHQHQKQGHHTHTLSQQQQQLQRQHHHYHQHSDKTCDLYSTAASSPTLQQQRASPFFFSSTPHDDSYNPLGYMSLSSNRLSHSHSHNIPFLSNRAVSPTCFPIDSSSSSATTPLSFGSGGLQSSVSMMVTSDDERIGLHYSSSSSDNNIRLPSVTITAGCHSSPASVGCSPVTSPITGIGE
ncbi:hypothetical protein EGW08_023241, partial [Elysia chlorotica]